MEHLTDWPITHGGIRRILHPRLNVEVDGQTCIRYLRFGKPVILDRLEIERLVYARIVPDVPTHPAHINIATLDRDSLTWQTVLELDLPYNPKIDGKGLSQDMEIGEMEDHFKQILKETPMTIPLDGLETDHLRIVCDREYPVWPSHGEMDGGTHNVPFGILNKVRAFGAPLDDSSASANYNDDYRPMLRQGEINPVAPKGMEIAELPDMVLYQGRTFSIGFNRYRPILMHLGWDIIGGKRGPDNRLFATRLPFLDKKMGGVSGPLLRTLFNDYPAHMWTGDVSIDRNRISYRNLEVIDGLKIDALFTVESDRFQVELRQACSKAIPVIDAACWRLAWDTTKGITGMAGMPTLKAGRNGDVALPGLWTGDGNGCLSHRLLEGNPGETRLQVESYRFESCVTGGFVFGEHPGENRCQVIPEGEKHAVYELALENFHPDAQEGAPEPSEGLKRHWGTAFSCFRPEFRGFSNNAGSTNCHQVQFSPTEIVVRTKRPVNGPNPFDLARYTIGRGLLDGGGYGYWRTLFLDTDPVLLSSAGRIHQADPNLRWLKHIEPGLVVAAERMLGMIDDSGMLICKNLSGNSGSYRWSSNAMDVVGFGHIDGYVNAWAYRAFRNVAAMLDDLSSSRDLVLRCRQAATKLCESYPSFLLNSETGWFAGWRSRDEQLHDYAFLSVNGVALAFGLLDEDRARKALTAWN